MAGPSRVVLVGHQPVLGLVGLQPRVVEIFRRQLLVAARQRPGQRQSARHPPPCTARQAAPPNEGMLGIAAGGRRGMPTRLAPACPRAASRDRPRAAHRDRVGVGFRCSRLALGGIPLPGSGLGAADGRWSSVASASGWAELYSDVHAAISAEFDVSSRLAPATTARISRSLPIRYRWKSRAPAGVSRSDRVATAPSMSRCSSVQGLRTGGGLLVCVENCRHYLQVDLRGCRVLMCQSNFRIPDRVRRIALLMFGGGRVVRRVIAVLPEHAGDSSHGTPGRQFTRVHNPTALGR